tara:strand:+ start:101 stop:748 length:648 start_codon:yes stop_codon:yes gene_type:complete
MSASLTTDDIWTQEVEALLAQWSEKASCWRWLYGRAEKKYRYKYYMFSIPVIILSTLTGTANFGMDSYVPENSKQFATAVVGGLNLFAGLLSTLQNFLKVAEGMESARNSCVSWGKLQRSIQIELSLDTKRRQNSHDFLKICRSEYDRLTEQSPIVDDDIIDEFKKKFKEYEISKPSICNGLDKCDIYRIKDESQGVVGDLEYVDEPVPQPMPQP